LVGYWLAGPRAWRLMFGDGAVPALFFRLLVLTVPESPRWLVAQNREREHGAKLGCCGRNAGFGHFQLRRVAPLPLAHQGGRQQPNISDLRRLLRGHSVVRALR
jgi:MFS family permease